MENIVVGCDREEHESRDQQNIDFMHQIIVGVKTHGRLWVKCGSIIISANRLISVYNQ
jgi:hypothetical protein